MPSLSPPSERIIRIRELTTLIGLSRSTVYSLINRSSPRYAADFPQPVRLGSSARGAVGWRLREVQHWLETRQRTSSGVISVFVQKQKSLEKTLFKSTT